MAILPECCHVDPSQLQAAISTLLAYIQKKKKDDLFQTEEGNIQLIFNLKKIPRLHNKIIKVALPTSLRKNNTDVCLFVKDIDQKSREYEESVRHFRKILDDEGITEISEIIPLKSLKLEYKPFEAKRNLSNRFDMFLADERIVRFLPTYLGKNFYGRKRYPVQVNLLATNLKKEIHRAMANTRCIIGGRGSSSQVTVAHTDMPESSIAANIMAATKQLYTAIPGGALNIRNFHIKTHASISLPIYLSTGPLGDVQLPDVKKPDNFDEPEEITTVIGAKVRVGRFGHVQLVKDPILNSEGQEVCGDEVAAATTKRKRTRKEKTDSKKVKKTGSKRNDAKKKKKTVK